MKETAEADLSGSIVEELDGLVSSNMVASFVRTTCTALPFAMLWHAADGRNTCMYQVAAQCVCKQADTSIGNETGHLKSA